MSKSVAFYTLGCKLNFSESSAMQRTLQSSGFRKGTFEEGADVYVINTCSVTDHADRKCKRVVKEALSYNPNALIAVVGCYAQLKPEEIAAIPGVDLVLGANEKFDLASHIDAAGGKQASGLALHGPIKEVKRFVPSYNAHDRTRTFLKVQDGCDYFCSFCTIPLARGRSRSGSIAETLETVRAIAASGVREVVLTGVNTGDFGRGHGEDFLQLLEALDRAEGIKRFRISSIEPNLCSDQVIDFVAQSQRFMPHFHMPLQSGSDAILERMRRRYDTALYADRVAHIRNVMPHACIGADVITGTPGETEEAFLQTHGFLRSTRPDYLHVFTYSERANTTAVRMPESVPMEERRQRTRQLRSLSAKLHRAFQQRHLGTVRPVLFEYGDSVAPGTHILGFTDNYLRVALPCGAAMANNVVPVSLDQVDADGHLTGCISAFAPSSAITAQTPDLLII